MKILILKKKPTLRDRILEIINAHGGRYYGFNDLATEAHTSSSALLYALRRLSDHGYINVRPGAFRYGEKTIVELAQ